MKAKDIKVGDRIKFPNSRTFQAVQDIHDLSESDGSVIVFHTAFARWHVPKEMEVEMEVSE